MTDQMKWQGEELDYCVPGKIMNVNEWNSFRKQTSLKRPEEKKIVNLFAGLKTKCDKHHDTQPKVCKTSILNLIRKQTSTMYKRATTMK